MWLVVAGALISIIVVLLKQSAQKERLFREDKLLFGKLVIVLNECDFVTDEQVDSYFKKRKIKKAGRTELEEVLRTIQELASTPGWMMVWNVLQWIRAKLALIAEERVEVSAPEKIETAKRDLKKVCRHWQFPPLLAVDSQQEDGQYLQIAGETPFPGEGTGKLAIRPTKKRRPNWPKCTRFLGRFEK